LKDADCEVCHAQDVSISGGDTHDHFHGGEGGTDKQVTLYDADDINIQYQLSAYADPLTDRAEATKLTDFCLSCHDSDGAGGDPTPFSGAGEPANIADSWQAVNVIVYNIIFGLVDYDGDNNVLPDLDDTGAINGTRIIGGYLDMNDDDLIDDSDDGVFETYTVIDGWIDVNSNGTDTGSIDPSPADPGDAGTINSNESTSHATISQTSDGSGAPTTCFGDGNFGCHGSGHGSEKLTLLAPHDVAPSFNVIGGLVDYDRDGATAGDPGALVTWI
jgi:hypothetical protein